MNDKFVKEVYPIETGLVNIGICPFCKKPINEENFRDKLSRKEYKQSGLCMSCQDEFFNE